jgi:hypothetical protein
MSEQSAMSESVPEFDLYATLGVARDASATEIASAHRALIRRRHPDVSVDPASSERAKKLNIARDWLTDPRRRALYDRANRHAASATSTMAARRPEVRRRRQPGWERSRQRAELEVFIARCAHLTRADVECLLVAHARLGTRPTEIAERVVGLTHELGRGRIAVWAASAALAAVPAGRPRKNEELVEVLRWTALGFAVADVAPGDAAVLLAPWREAVERPDPRHWVGAAVRRARRALAAAVLGALIALVLGLAFMGFVVMAGLVWGA